MVHVVDIHMSSLLGSGYAEASISCYQASSGCNLEWVRKKMFFFFFFVFWVGKFRYPSRCRLGSWRGRQRFTTPIFLSPSYFLHFIFTLLWVELSGEGDGCCIAVRVWYEVIESILDKVERLSFMVPFQVFTLFSLIVKLWCHVFILKCCAFEYMAWTFYSPPLTWEERWESPRSF